MIDTKTFVKKLNKKSVAVYGLGLSGFSVAKSLIAGGATVYGWDEDEEKRYKASHAGIQILNLEEEDMTQFDVLVLSPGVPLNFPDPHLVVKNAREAGTEIVGDLEVFYRCGHGLKTVGITGTNGKSTTTALVHHILTQERIPNVMGGNIGTPVMDLKLPPRDGVIVLEISSYQMDLCPSFRPDISVLLNVTPDHIDRHGDMEGYVAAKERIFEGSGVAICNIDDQSSLQVYERTKKAGFRNIQSISIHDKDQKGVFVKDGYLYDHLGTDKKEIGSVLNIPSLLGVHNQQNICAAYAVCRSLGMAPDSILDHIKTYPGLLHRQYTARVINGIPYINDSKATNADAVSKALACYHNIYLIAGGRAKEGGLNGLEIFSDRISHLFLIGEAMEEFCVWAQKIGIPYTKSFSLDVAVLESHKMAQSKKGEPGSAPTVLLSPACASWDQFKSFEHRGEVFMNLVNALSEEI